MKPWAERFYNSDAWRSCRDSFLKSKGYLCERCSTPDDPVTAKIAHHKTYLTKQNIPSPLSTAGTNTGSPIPEHTAFRRLAKVINSEDFLL